MASITSIIDAIDTAIASLVTESPATWKYKIGDKTIDKTAVLAELRATREYYQRKLEETPYEEVSEFALDITPLGVDDSEYIGDATT